MNSTNFIENKYKRWYFSIIENARGRKYDGSLHERHHVIPASLGGSNKSDNLVCLTYKEHFICHWLLSKFTESYDKQKMHHALRMMANSSSCNKRVLSNKQYEIARSALTKIKRVMSDDFRKKQSENRKGQLNPMFGRKQTEKQRQKAKENFLLCEEVRKEKVIIANKKRKGLKHKTVECTFCNKVGSVSNMKRWHFNNCKKAS